MVTPSPIITHDSHELQVRLLGALNEYNDNKNSCLSSEEQQWVRLAIQREAQSIKLRQAIIEKTMTALAWLLVLGFLAIVKEYLVNHGWKL